MSVLPQVVTRNWRLKLSALGLAVFLWAIVTIQPRNREILPDVPLRVEASDPDWVLVAADPPTVSVNLGGLTSDLLELPRGDEAFVRVPIGDVNSADTVVRLRADWVVLSAGSNIVVQDITPAVITLTFERALTTALPLSRRTEGELPEQLALVAPLGLSPQVTTVRGPARVIEALDSVALEPLDLGAITQSGAHRVRVDTTGLSMLTFQPEIAQISVNVQPSVMRTVSAPVVVEAPEGVDVATLLPEPAMVEVRLVGAQTPVTQVMPGSFVARVAASDLAGIAPGSRWTVPIRIVGLSSIIRAQPATDSVSVFRALAPPQALPPGTDTAAPPNAPASPDTAAPDTLAAPRGRRR